MPGFASTLEQSIRASTTIPTGALRTRMAGSPAGIHEYGNINILERPKVRNTDGSFSTVKSLSFGTDRGEVLVPSIRDDGYEMTPQEAVEQYRRTGLHLGIFQTPAHADMYARQLHAQQAAHYADKPDDSFVDIMAAAFKQFPVASALPGVTDWMAREFEGTVKPSVWKEGEGWVDPDWLRTSFGAQKGYSVFQDVERTAGLSGEELLELRDVRSPEELAYRLRKRKSERRAHELIARNGGTGMAAIGIAAGLDPFTLFSIAMPLSVGATGSRAWRVGKAVGAVAASDTAGELLMHSGQELRRPGDSLVNIGTGVLLSSALGAWATRIGKAPVDELAKQLDDIAEGRSVGAAATPRAVLQTTTERSEALGYATAAELGPPKGAGWIAKTFGRISPLTRTLNAKVAAGKALALRMVSPSYPVQGNITGNVVNPLALSDAVESAQRMKGQYSLRALNRLYEQYAERAGKEAVSEYKFNEQVHHHGLGIESDVPEVRQAVADIRKIVFQADRESLIKLNVFDISTEEGKKALEEALDPDYWPHVWDQIAVSERGPKFQAQLQDLFTRYPQIPAPTKEALTAAQKMGVDVEGPLPVVEGMADTARKVAAEALKADRANRRVLREAERKLKDVEKDLEEARTKADDLEFERDNTLPGEVEAAIEAKAAVAKQYGEGVERVKELSRGRSEARSEVQKARHLRVTLAKRLAETERQADSAKRHADDLREKLEGLPEDAAGADPAVLERLGNRVAKKLDAAEGRVVELEERAAQERTALIEIEETQSRLLDDVSSFREDLADAGSEVRALRKELHAAKVDTLDEAQARATAEINKLRHKALAADAKAAELRQKAIEADELKDTVRQASRDAVKAAKEIKQDAAAIARYRKGKDEAITRERDPADIESSARKTYDKIIGLHRGHISTEGVVTARPLRERALKIPKAEMAKWAPFMVQDLQQVLQSYIRSVTPHIETARLGLSKNLENEFKVVEDEYASARATAEAAERKAEQAVGMAANAQEKKAAEKAHKKAVEERQALEKEESNVLRDAGWMRDRIFNRAGANPGTAHLTWIRAAGLVRDVNYQRLMGMSGFTTAVTDGGKFVLRYGLQGTGRLYSQFFGNLKLNKVYREDAKRMNAGLDWAIDTQASARNLAEAGDVRTGGRGFLSSAERFADRSGALFTRATGMATFNSSHKMMAAVHEVDATLRAALKLATDGSTGLNDYRVGVLRSMGFGDSELRTIAEQFTKHGEVVDGVLHRPRTELWDDTPGARYAANLLDIAGMRAADIITGTRNVGDLSLVMDAPLAKSLFQFKGFAMTSVNRLMIPAASGIAQGDLASINGAQSLLFLGAARYYFGELANGREPDTSPDKLIGEAINWSGLMGFAPDFLAPLAMLAPEPARSFMRSEKFKNRGVFETLLGPTFGTAGDVFAAISNLTGPTGPDDPLPSISQNDIHMVRKLILWQNIVGWRRVLDGMEGELGEAFDAEGATVRPFIDRVTDVKPLEAR